MMNPITSLDGIAIIDLQRLWAGLIHIPQEERIREASRMLGVPSLDNEGAFISDVVVGLSGIGGVPLEIGETARQVRLLGTELDSVRHLQRSFQTIVGLTAAFTYMNPKNKTPQDLGVAVMQRGHFSGLHAVYLNLSVFGISCAVELELACQRDLVHVARVTSARTRAQSRPAMVVIDESLYAQYRATRDFLLGTRGPGQQQLEARNALFPLAKATCLMMSGTGRNLLRLCEQRSDEGKEEEYRRMLDRVAQVVVPLLCPERPDTR